MAEKVAKLTLERDHKNFLYFIDGTGNVCRKGKSASSESEIVVANAVQRDNRFLYYVDKDGDVSRTARKVRGSTGA